MLDQFFICRRPIAAPRNIAVVLVDFESFRRLGLPSAYPWPRRLYAEVLHILKAEEAEAVLFDVAFAEDSPEPGDDDKLAEALGILPTFIPDGVLGAFESGSVVDYRLDISPLKKFSDRVLGTGGIGVVVDALHKIRHFPLGKISMVANAAASLRNVPVVTEDDPDYFRKYINYYGTPYPFDHVSIADVLEHKVPAGFFKNRIVLIGPDLILENVNVKVEGKDIWVAPDGESILGVMVEATALGNFITGKYISRIPEEWENILLMVSIFLAVLLLLTSSPSYVIVIVTVTTIIAGSVAWILFLNLIFLPVLMFVIILWLVAIGRSFQFYLWEQKRKAFLAQQFGCYLDPLIVRQIITSGQAPDLGGRLIGCALMFTDIIGFSTYSESRSPIDVGESLNGYFTRIQAKILSQKGTLLSMLGDGLFALWGAPVAVSQECDQALAAARGIHEGELDSANLRTRIGLHYGEVLVGHFGSRERFDYSAIGDEVNLASRIEGLNRMFGTYILMSEAFVNRLSNIDLILYVGKVQVAGISRPVGVYTIDPYGIKYLWEQGVRFFEQGHFAASKEVFNSLNVSHPFSERLTSPYIEAILEGEGARYLVASGK